MMTMWSMMPGRQHKYSAFCTVSAAFSYLSVSCSTQWVASLWVMEWGRDDNWNTTHETAINPSPKVENLLYGHRQIFFPSSSEPGGYLIHNRLSIDPYRIYFRRLNLKSIRWNKHIGTRIKSCAFCRWQLWMNLPLKEYGGFCFKICYNLFIWQQFSIGFVDERLHWAIASTRKIFM